MSAAKDMLLGYVVILAVLLLATLLIGSVAYWAVHSRHKISDDAFVKWVGLPWFTLALFGWVVKRCRSSWRHKEFWITMGALLMIHTALFSVVLTHVARWPVAGFAGLLTLEVIPIMKALDWSRDRFRGGR